MLGAAGLLGSGRSSLARLLFGMEPLVAGEILVKGAKANICSPRDAIAAGIALIPEDRLLEGVIAQHSVAANIVLPVLERVSRYSWMSDAAAAEATREQIAQLRIKTASADAAVNTLSGGNQQKVVVGKWLARTPAILVLDEPTAGVDIGAKSEIVRLVRQLARARTRDPAYLVRDAGAARGLRPDRRDVGGDGSSGHRPPPARSRFGRRR